MGTGAPPRAGRLFPGLYLLFTLTLGICGGLVSLVETYAFIDPAPVRRMAEEHRALTAAGRPIGRSGTLLRDGGGPVAVEVAYHRPSDQFLLMIGYRLDLVATRNVPILVTLALLLAWNAPLHLRRRPPSPAEAERIGSRLVRLPGTLCALGILAALLRGAFIVALFAHRYGPPSPRILGVYAVTTLVYALFAVSLTLNVTRHYVVRRMAWPLFRETGRLAEPKRGRSPSLALQFGLTVAALGALPVFLGLYLPLHFNPALLGGSRLEMLANFNLVIPFGMFAILAVYFVPSQIAAAWLFRSSVQKPLDALVRRMDRVAKGDFACPTTVLSTDEVGVLKGHFNRMLEGLAERERMRDTFGRYVSPEIAARILADGPERLAGVEVDATVLFCDIRDFTPLSEGMAPPELLAFLNRYFDAVVEPVRREGGVVNKFIGDAVMALFSPVFGSERHAAAACRAALGMRAALASFNASSGRPPVRFGVGLHTGRLVAGNLGTAERLEYTVIGDTVNVASRVESATKGLGADLLCTGATVAACGERAGFAFASAGPADLKGKSGPVELFRFEAA